MNPNTILDAPIFAGLAGEVRLRIGSLVRRRRLAGGETLFQKGDPGEGLYAIVSGAVRIITSHEDGRELAFNLLGPGDVFGEIALIDGLARTADAIAVHETELDTLSRADFDRLLSEDPVLARNVAVALCGLVRRLSRQVEDANFLDIAGRLARVLIDLSSIGGAEIKTNQEDLAKMIGATRVSVNQRLQDWRGNGWIELARGRVVVRSPQALLALIDEPMP